MALFENQNIDDNQPNLNTTVTGVVFFCVKYMFVCLLSVNLWVSSLIKYA